MPTLVGARRRGYTSEGFRLFIERVGVAKADSWIDYSVLEDAMRDDLNERAERRVAVLDPVKLVIDNYPEAQEEDCLAPNHPQAPELGKRKMPFSRELWIEREDFQEQPQKGFFRLAPEREVRLRYAYIVKCVGVEHDPNGHVAVIHCTYDPASKSSQAQDGAADSASSAVAARKVKGNIHWVSARHAHRAEVRLYDRLFSAAHPGAGERDYLLDINPHARKVVQAYLEPALAAAEAEQRFQFERHGYFIADRIDSKAGAPVFNRTVSLKDSWAKDAPARSK